MNERTCKASIVICVCLAVLNLYLMMVSCDSDVDNIALSENNMSKSPQNCALVKGNCNDGFFDDDIEKNDANILKKQLKAIERPHDGIINGIPQITYENKKSLIDDIPGIPKGVYVVDVYTTSGKIELPSGATGVEFDLSGVCGYSNWTIREEGVIKSIVQTKKNGTIHNILQWSFYTILVKYNPAGLSIGVVLPEDSAKIKIPYRFTY